MVLKKTDLDAVRSANMRIVKNKDGDYTPADIARASRIVIQLKQIELKIESLAEKTLPENVSSRRSQSLTASR